MNPGTLLSPAPRTFPRIKFVWGSSDRIATRWRLGLFGFYQRIHGFPRSGFAISVRGLLRWMAVLAVLGYFGLAALGTFWFRRNPYNRIGFTDVLTWPVRREHIRRLRAEAWLAQGRAGMEKQRWAEAVFYLQRGLEVRRDDFASRFLLAQYYVLIGERARALALILEGLKYGRPPRSHLESSFAVAFAGEDWNSALQICERTLPYLGAPRDRREQQWVLGRKLAVLNATQRHAEALALGEAEGDAADTPVRLERGGALVALGRPAEAADLLQRWRSSTNVIDEPLLLRLRIEALRAAGRLDEMARALAELRALHPTRPEPAALAVEQHVRAGREPLRVLDDYLFRFGAKVDDLLLVARPLAAIPDLPLLQRVVAAARERGFSERPFRVQWAEALLRQGEWTELNKEVERLAAFPRTGEFELWFAWMHALTTALSAPADGAAESILTVLRHRGLSLEAHQLVITALIRCGRHDAARDVLAVSRRLYAESPWLIARQAEIDQALAAAAAVTVVPPVAGVTVAASWEDFMATLQREMDAQRWTEARQLVRNAREARPAWLEAHAPDLTLRELRIAQARADRIGMQVALDSYVTGSAVRAAEILAFAREWARAGAKDDAIMLLKAVLEKSPNHGLARALLAELQPPPRKEQ